MSELTFLNPLGLLALAAIALPLAIHLISRSRGRIVSVGNVNLYRGRRRLRVLEPRLQQWLLFLLRALLLLLAALWLAGLARPYGVKLEGSTAYVTREWLSVSGRDLSEFSSHDQVFLLAEGFPVLDAAAAEVSVADGFAVDSWSLLAQRLTSVQHRGELHVYALAAARQFPARAPALGVDLTWHLDDSAAAAQASVMPGIDITLRYPAARRADAQAVAAALELLTVERRIDLRYRIEAVSELSAAAASSGDFERRVLILLDDGAAPADGFDAVLQDTTAGSGEADVLRLDQAPGFRFSVRPRAAPDTGEEVLWRSERGAPLLTVSTRNGRTHLRLLDELTLRDNGLLNSEVFPDVLLRLLLGESAWAAGTDAAPVDPAAAVARGSLELREPLQSLAPWLALAMALLLSLERWLSERSARSDEP